MTRPRRKAALVSREAFLSVQHLQVGEAARRLGVTTQQAYYAARRHGGKFKSGKRAFAAEVRATYAACAHMTVADAAKHLGVRPRTVVEAAARYNLSFADRCARIAMPVALDLDVLEEIECEVMQLLPDAECTVLAGYLNDGAGLAQGLQALREARSDAATRDLRRRNAVMPATGGMT